MSLLFVFFYRFKIVKEAIDVCSTFSQSCDTLLVTWLYHSSNGSGQQLTVPPMTGLWWVYLLLIWNCVWQTMKQLLWDVCLSISLWELAPVDAEEQWRRDDSVHRLTCSISDSMLVKHRTALTTVTFTLNHWLSAEVEAVQHSKLYHLKQAQWFQLGQSAEGSSFSQSSNSGELLTMGSRNA